MQDVLPQEPFVTQSTKREPSSEGQQEANAVPPDEVRKTLTAILQSVPFRSSVQIQKVLKFLVLETLAGRGETLKERNIGARLFERSPDYDTNSDPIVRLRVAEVRKRLALYYQGASDPTVLINIPSGSFRAVFAWSGRNRFPVAVDSLRRPESAPVLIDTVAPWVEKGAAVSDGAPTSTRFRLWRWWIVAAAVLAIAAAAALRYYQSPEERAFNGFWSPILENPNTVLIGMGNNPLYELSNAGEDEYHKTHPKNKFEEMGLHSYVPLSPEFPIDPKYFKAGVDTYLTVGDVEALSDIEYILAQRHRKLDMRFVNDVTYGDLRQNPTILIGAHNNIWTLSMTENLRFGFEGHSAVVDRFTPQKQWIANADRSETYAIVARVLNGWNGKVVILIGGVGYAATRAAADFITNPQSVGKMAKSLPRDWETKNVEIVLHTTVKNQIPLSTDVIASYTW